MATYTIADLHAACQRFYSHVQRDSPDGCHLWLACRDGRGYGIFTQHQQNLLAHRVAWILVHGPIPDGLFVLHRCDNPPCVNVAHLFLGTATDNIRDATAKGRTRKGDQHWSHVHPERRARGDRHGSQTHPDSVARGARHGSKLHPNSVPRGERHHKNVLTDAQILEIRRRAKQGDVRAQIARDFSVTATTVHKIVHRQSHRYLPEE